MTRWLGFQTKNSLMGLSVEFALGIAAVDLIWLGFGFAHLWVFPFLRIFFGGVLLFLVLDAFRRPFRFPRSLPAFPEWPFRLSALGGILYWLFSALHGFLPETHNDGLVYHLGTPVYWLLNHGITDFPNQPHASFPYGGELFLLTGYLFQGPEAAKLINSVVLGFCALASAGWAWEAGGRHSGWLAFSLTLTLPLLVWVSISTQIEGFLSLYLVLFFYFLFQFVSRPAARGDQTLVFLSGLWGGMALSVKYTAVLGLGIGFLLLLRDKRVWKDYFKKKFFLIFGAGLLGIYGIWLLKNWAYTANPLYPYFDSLLGGRKMSAQGFQWMIEDQRFVPTGGEWWNVPWNLLMTGSNPFGFVGPVLMSFLPAIFLFRFKTPEWRWLAWAVVLLGITGLGTTQILKFHAPGIILFFILFSAAGGSAPFSWWGKGAALTAFLSALFCFPLLAGMSGFYCSGGGMWSAGETRDQYLGRVIPHSPYPACRFISENLPRDSRLLIAGDSRVLYYPRPFRADSGYETPFLASLFQKAGNLEQVRLKIREAGFTHLVVNVGEGIRLSAKYPHYDLTSGQWRLLDDYFKRGLDVIYRKDPIVIFQVRQALKETADKEGFDPLLYFSRPVVGFLLARQKGNLEEAEIQRKKILELYPFITRFP